MQAVEGERLTRFQKAPEVESAPLQGESILFHPLSKKFFVLNQTAAYVWERLDSPTAVEDLAQGLCEAYQGVELSVARRDVSDALTRMVEMSLVVPVEPTNEDEAKP